MTRLLGYSLIALGFLLAQTNLLPAFLPYYCKPELLLLLVIYLCMTESLVRGALIAWAIGALLDTCGGHDFGLHATIYLIIFIAGRWLLGALNTESPLLLLIFVFCGSLAQTLLLMLLGIFADIGGMFSLFAQRAMFQASINVIAAYLLLLTIARIQRRLAPRLSIPGFSHLLDSRHGA